MTNDLRAAINTRLLERIEALAAYLYPNGKKQGYSWRVGSFDINLKTSRWGDWDGSTNGHSKSLIDPLDACHRDRL